MSAKAKLQLPTIMGSTSQGTPKEPQTAYDLQPKASEPEQSDRSNSPATPSITVGNDGQGNDGQVRNQNTWTTRLWPQISGNSQMAVSGAALASSSEPGDPVAMDKPAHDQRMTDSARQDHAEPRGWLSWWQSSQIADRQVVQEDPRSVNAESTNRRPTSPLGAVHKSPADTPSRPASGWALWSHYRGPSLPAQRSTDDQTGKVAVVRRASDPVRETQVSASNLPDSVSQPQSTRTLASNTSTKNEDTDVLPAKAKQSSSVPKAVNLRSSAQLPPNDNLLFPSLDSTFALSADEFGLLRRFNRWIFNVRNTTSSNLIQDRPRINTAVAIGVHGLFPTPMLQTLLGKPTGTSIKFAEMAAEAINKFALHNECSIQNVEKLALEGSGRIEERLEALWKILLSWVDLIRKADLLFVACHSQGVPVAISLVSKLIQFGCCKKGVKIGICAMAGVNLGPFAEFKSRWIGGSAGELFDFARSESRVSKDYRAALDVVLKFGARLTFIGSLDDQLVPLHSSCFSSIRHPNVYRAVWVDGRLHVANFLTGLVGFALKLRNLGTPDHGLIRELSKPLAGSLVGGEGHSVCHPIKQCWFKLWDGYVNNAYGLGPQYAISVHHSRTLLT